MTVPTCAYCHKKMRRTITGDGYGYAAGSPFCTLTCGYRFGRAAHEAGYRMVPKKTTA